MFPPSSGRRFARPRDWICPLVTLAVAVLWALATKGAANHVNHGNLARLMGTVMFGTSLSPDAGDGTSSPFLLPGERRNRSGPGLPLFHNSLARQSEAVETTTYIWRWGMTAVAILLALTGIVSLAVGWARPLHLAAAVVILASSIGTYVALRQLVDPARGGLAEQPSIFYALVLGLQSLYGWVLLILFARHPGSQPAIPLAGPHPSQGEPSAP